MIFVWIYFWIAAMVAAYLFVRSSDASPWIHARNSVLCGIFWLPIVMFYAWIIFLLRMAMSGDE